MEKSQPNAVSLDYGRPATPDSISFAKGDKIMFIQDDLVPDAKVRGLNIIKGCTWHGMHIMTSSSSESSLERKMVQFKYTGLGPPPTKCEYCGRHRKDFTVSCPGCGA